MDESHLESSSPCTRCAEDYAQREPTKAFISAFAVGTLLSILPLGAILGAGIRAAVGLAKPALYFLGLMKLCEYCSGKRAT